ncbi:hypothetical protein BpHYR1_043702 [Brachionus plicatilis]|uniref:Uncharacterized protein n=1 Tax=Brachionus plicatilis TaxID=10195 RepID=A0A3M7T4Q4_BRAPC|nr:hypothetical protein BpHYR1_043702 [Brachionus plicatilis]
MVEEQKMEFKTARETILKKNTDFSVNYFVRTIKLNNDKYDLVTKNDLNKFRLNFQLITCAGAKLRMLINTEIIFAFTQYKLSRVMEVSLWNTIFPIFCSTSFRFIDKLVLFLNSSFNANKCAQYPNLVKNLQEHFLLLSSTNFTFFVCFHKHEFFWSCWIRDQGGHIICDQSFK